MKWSIILVGVLLLAVGLVGSAGAEEPRYGGEIVIARAIDSKNLDARWAPVDGPSLMVTLQIYEPLVELNEKLEPIPVIAESWENPDELTYIFHLRQGVKFHDGTELTAEDVKFTFEWVMDPTNELPTRVHLEMIEAVEVIDDYTVKIILKHPNAPFITLTIPQFGIVPKHVAENLGEDFGFNPIGAGPFKFVKWVSEDYIELEAFEDYFRGRPYLDKVTFRVIPEEAVQVLELEAGGVDFIMSVPADEFERLADDPNITIVRYPGTGFMFIGPNLKHPILSDVRIRHAISYAIDREMLIEVAEAGLAVPATGPLQPGLWAHTTEGVRTYPHNPEKAKQLLAEAGFPDGFKSGLLTIPTEPFRTLAVVLKEQLGKIGIELELELVEFGVFLDKFFAHEFELSLMSWGGIVDPDYGVYPLFKTGAGFNIVQYSNAAVDALLEAGRKTLDMEKRKQIYHQIQRILAEELPHIFVYHAETTRAYNPRLKGFIHAGRRYYGPLNDLERVWWGKKEK
jgi:peptide/nickel transport system substrate-binding protein